jgi:3-oxoadipate enol-lactonase
MQSTEELEITIDDLFISYSDEGNESDPTIVFIHGFPLNKSMWSSQTAALRDRYRVITYDVRGFGNSKTGTEELTIDLFVSDLSHLLDKLKLKTVILCGLSMGGYIALRAMERFPEKFDALVLCDTQYTADSPEARDKRIKTIDSIKSDGLERYADEALNGFFFKGSVDKKSKEIIETRWMIESNSKEVLCNTLMAMANRSETCSQLENIEIPVLILVGKEDTITPPASAEFIQSKINGATLHRLENAAHLSNLDNPTDFNKYLEDFLALVTSKKL